MPRYRMHFPANVFMTVVARDARAARRAGAKEVNAILRADAGIDLTPLTEGRVYVADERGRRNFDANELTPERFIIEDIAPEVKP